MVLEHLEKRLAPAGLVTAEVSGGALKLTGDFEANDISVVQIAPNSFTVQGNNGTLIKFGSETEESFVVTRAGGGLVVDLKDGSDTLSLETLRVAGHTTIQLGAGDNVLHFIGPTKINGNLTILGLAGADEILGNDSFAIGGQTKIDLGQGVNSASFIGATTHSFVKGFSYKGGTGGDSLNFAATGAMGVGGAFTFSAGDGPNDLSFAVGGNLIFTAFSFTGGKGTSNLNLTSFANLTFSGAVNVKLNGDYSDVAIAANAITIKGALNYTALAHDENTAFNIQSAALNIGGSATLKNGGGLSDISFRCDTMAVRGSLAITHGDNGGPSAYMTSTTVETTTLTVGGSLSITNGNGRFSTNLSGNMEVGGNFSIANGSTRSENFTYILVQAATLDIGGSLTMVNKNGYFVQEISAGVLEVDRGIRISNQDSLPNEATNTVLSATELATTSIQITNGKGIFSDQIQIGSGLVKGGIQVKNGDTISDSFTNTQIAGSFAVGGGITIENATGNYGAAILSEGHIEVGGSVKITNGNTGAAEWVTAVFVNTQIGNGDYSMTINKDLTIKNGHGIHENTMGGQTMTVKGNVSVTNGNVSAGHQSFTKFDLDNLARIGGSLTVKNGSGEFINSFKAPELSIGRAVNISNGHYSAGPAGAHEISFSGDSVSFGGAVTLTNASGDTRQNFVAQSLDFGSSLKITSGAGVDSVWIKAETIDIGGSVTLKHGAGGSTSTFETETETEAGGALNLGGSLSVTALDGNDTLLVRSAGVIKGGIQAAFGEGAVAEVNLATGSNTGGLAIKGALNFTSSAHETGKLTLDFVNLTGALSFTGSSATDSVLLQNSYLQRTVKLDLLAGNDQVKIGNSVIGGAFTLKAGEGHDGLDLSNAAATPTEFRGTVSVDMGAGDDVISVGDIFGAEDYVTFFRSTLFEGGAGSNDLWLQLQYNPQISQPTFLAGPPTLRNFILHDYTA